MDLKITDNRQFRKTIKPRSPVNQNISKKITLIDKQTISKKITLKEGKIISNDADLVEPVNICFPNDINNLDIKRYQGILENNSNLDSVNAINKLQNHPSVIKIKGWKPLMYSLFLYLWNRILQGNKST